MMTTPGIHRSSLIFGLVIVSGIATTVLSAQSISRVGKSFSCNNGTAVGFACNSADLLSVLTPADMGASAGIELNDLWGWTDESTGREFAIVGRYDGTAFVEVTDPLNPVYVGELLSNSSDPSVWRDMKVYKDHAYIVSDGGGGFGMQVFDLRQLRASAPSPVTFEVTAQYDGFLTAHNIVINEDTGFAYVVGVRGLGETCGGGLHMINLEFPESPRFAGCFAHEGTGIAGTGYTHDAQCVVYHGPDTRYSGDEICFSANETDISVDDVSDKAAPFAISRASYPTASYIHQGWLTEDHRYFVQNDELDEFNGRTPRTRTLFWDVQDLEDPFLISEYLASSGNPDHNLYVKGTYVFQSNYVAGLRVLDISDIENPHEVAFFDTHPAPGGGFGGSWSNYPFFKSGAIGVTSDKDGLFMVQPTIPGLKVSTESDELPDELELAQVYPNPFSSKTTLSFSVRRSQPVRVVVYDLLGRELKTLFSGMANAGTEERVSVDASSLSGGTYYLRIQGDNFRLSRQVTIVK